MRRVSRGADTAARRGTTRLKGLSREGLQRCRDRVSCVWDSPKGMPPVGMSHSQQHVRGGHRGCFPRTAGESAPEAGVGAEGGCLAQPHAEPVQVEGPSWPGGPAQSGAHGNRGSCRPWAGLRVGGPRLAWGSRFTPESCPARGCHLSQGPSWPEGPLHPGAPLHPGLPSALGVPLGVVLPLCPGVLSALGVLYVPVLPSVLVVPLGPRV